MDKYQMIKKLGSGSFGVVWRAFNTQTSEIVAIKQLLMKYESSSNKIMINRELKSLINNKHENIVNLKEIIKEGNTIFLVFECMQGSLNDHMVHRMKAPFYEAQVRNVCFQILQGLACMHSNGYIHRDLKPANLLVSNNVVKISDLGSTRETNDKRPYTHYVTTAWYRAPEVFLRSEVYNSSVDMWAVGAIMVELFTFRPLFQGSSDARVMHKICTVLGSPTKSFWRDGLELARNMRYQFPDLPGLRFSELLPTASSNAVNLISSLLSWAPNARPTAIEALQHPFFHACYRVPPSVGFGASLVFEVAALRELVKKKSSLRSSASDRVRVEAHDDFIRMLPENPFEFMKSEQLMAN